MGRTTRTTSRTSTSRIFVGNSGVTSKHPKRPQAVIQEGLAIKDLTFIPAHKLDLIVLSMLG